MIKYISLLFLLVFPLVFSSEISTQPIVVVSCSGKGAGTSLTYSFYEIGCKTVHAHSINQDLMNMIYKESQLRSIIVIDSIREIVSRKISSYFENLLFHLEMDVPKIIEAYEADRWGFIDYLIEDFNKKFISIETYYSFHDWKKFGYDALRDQPFDFDKKYQIHQIDNIYFINIRFEDIAQWKEIIKSIGLPIDLRNFEIVRRNITRDKFLKQIYEDFLDRVTFTKDSFNHVYENNKDELCHFYTSKERDAFISKWENHSR